jgi:hypothetical protein
MNYGRGWLYWTLVVLSGAALILVLANSWLIESNRTVQAEVNRRQEFIAQTAGISKIHQTLVRSLADAAVANNDDRLRDLLAQQGITINANSSAERGVVMPPAVAPPAKSGK